MQRHLGKNLGFAALRPGAVDASVSAAGQREVAAPIESYAVGSFPVSVPKSLIDPVQSVSRLRPRMRSTSLNPPSG